MLTDATVLEPANDASTSDPAHREPGAAVDRATDETVEAFALASGDRTEVAPAAQAMANDAGEPAPEQAALPFAVEPHDAEAAARRLRLELEALLFVTSEPLGVAELARLTGADRPAVASALTELASEYAQRGIVVREVAGGYRFATAAAARAPIEAYLKPPKTTLSPAAMETLAIVAYLPQPVTKAEIEAVRGVNVDGVVATLVDRRFLADAGRRDVPGRPVQYVTTPEFLESFGLRSLGELPPVNLEALAAEAELPVATRRDGDATNGDGAAAGRVERDSAVDVRSPAGRAETVDVSGAAGSNEPAGAALGIAGEEEVHPSNE